MDELRVVLERIAAGAPLSEVLDGIIQLLATPHSGMICSILLYSEENGTLLHGAALGLPQVYVDAIHGSPIGPRAGSCGTAAFRREKVVVEDIESHPYWEEYRHLALPHGLRACWSTPVIGSNGDLLGTFALYYRERRGPTPDEIAWVDTAQKLAAIALVRVRSEQALRKSEARAQELARLYAVSSGIRDALVHLRQPAALYAAACRVIVEQGFARLSWVGIYDGAADLVRPAACFGPESAFVDRLHIAREDERHAGGPAARCLRSGEAVIINDISADEGFYWKSEAMRRGLFACAVFPLRSGDETYGVMEIYGAKRGFFRDEETDVLGRVVEDIAFAVDVAAKETERRALLVALRQRVKELSLLHRVSRVLQTNGPIHRALLEEVVALVPGAWFHPELCAARIVWGTLEANTPGFKQTPWTLSADFGPGGLVEVVYLEPPADAGDDCFLPEERELIRSLADLLGSNFGRARLEEQLRQSQKMQAIGLLAGGVAHDFNNVLTVILSYAMLAAEQLEPADPLTATFREIRSAGERAATLTRQLLAFSRKQVLDLRVTDVNRVISGLDKMLLRLVGEGVLVSRVAPSTVGRVLVDRGQLEQVIVNLVVNARDAMPEGGSLTLETANAELDEKYAAEHHGVVAGSYVMLAVSDSGVGMDPDTCARMFEPFFTTKSNGTGLGLATVWGIVTQSGGHVSVYSELGLGTTFKVYLPRVEGDLDLGIHDGPEPRTVVGTETILLVEDSEQVRVLVGMILRKNGYKVLEAQNGGEAFMVCEKHKGPIDLLLTDLAIPRMSGRELAERLVAMRPEIKVLYVSGYTENALQKRGMLDMDAAFLAKPLTPGPLLRKLREVLGDRGP